jgi:hypothetical protein
MMTLEKWTAVIAHLFVLCGVHKMDEQQHGYYIAAMFAELKERFTDDEIGIAARQIAETENLYGAYPSLATWLKYAPAERLRIHNSNKQTAYIREFLHDVSDIDPMVFDADMMEKDFIETYGDHGKYVLMEFGGVRGLRLALRNATQFTQESIIKDFINAWERSKTDMRMNLPQLEKEKTLQIEQDKNDN